MTGTATAFFIAGFEAALSEVKAGALPSKIYHALLDGTRRPGWLKRPLKPVPEAWKLPEKPFGR